MGRIVTMVLGAPFLVACSSTTTGDDCSSHYDVIAEAAGRAEVRDAVVDGAVPRARSTRVQGHHDGKTTVDVLDRRGRRLMQVDVFRGDDGVWVAGRWAQCID